MGNGAQLYAHSGTYAKLREPLVSKKAEALEGIVVGLPGEGTAPELDRFPPELRGVQWPRISDTAQVADLSSHA
jgi:hypothetical protein